MHPNYFIFQLFSMERVQYKLKGNWMMIMNQVGASIWVICRNHQFKGLMAFPPKTELHATSHNGVKLTIIQCRQWWEGCTIWTGGIGKCTCMTVYEYKFNIRINHFSRVLQQMKSLKAENEKLRRQLDQDKPKSSKYILALHCRDLAIPFGFCSIRLISPIRKPASCVAWTMSKQFFFVLFCTIKYSKSLAKLKSQVKSSKYILACCLNLGST